MGSICWQHGPQLTEGMAHFALAVQKGENGSVHSTLFCGRQDHPKTHHSRNLSETQTQRGTSVCVCTLSAGWEASGMRNSARKMDLWYTVQVGDVQAAVA